MWTREGASCAESDPSLFFPLQGPVSTAVRNICNSCDVLDKCLANVLNASHNEDIGIEASMNSKERREFRLHDKDIFRYLGEITDGAA